MSKYLLERVELTEDEAGMPDFEKFMDSVGQDLRVDDEGKYICEIASKCFMSWVMSRLCIEGFIR